MSTATVVEVRSRSRPRKTMSLIIAVRETLMVMITPAAQTVSRERMSVMEKPSGSSN